MRLVAIYNRNVERAAGVYTYVSAELQPIVAGSQAVLDEAIRRKQPVVTEDAFLLA